MPVSVSCIVLFNLFNDAKIPFSFIYADFNKLEKMCKQYKNYAEMGFIFDTKNLLNLKDSPTDKGKETFLKLYKEAHWI